jgi:hypothetical protein
MELKNKFVDRKKIFDIATTDIFSNITHVIEAIVEYMDVQSLYTRGGKLEWVDISLIEQHVEEPFCILIGNVWYPAGTELQLEDGTKATVTTDTEGYFRRLLRVGLPLKVLESGIKQEALDYLAKTESEMKEEEKELRQNLLTGMDLNIEPENPTIDFDLSTLTTEQQSQLKLFTKMGRG